MCCGLKIESAPLKQTVFFTSFVLGAIGVASIALGFMFGILLPFALQEDQQLQIYDAKVYIGSFFFYQGFSLIIVAILAFYTKERFDQKWKKNSILCAYIFFGFILLLSVLGLAILSLTIVTVHQSYSSDERACVREEIFRQSHRMYKKSADILCSEDCPCDIFNDKLYDNTQLEQLDYEKNEGAINIMGCPQFDEMNQRMGWNEDAYNHTNFITTLEVTLDCAGICAPSPFYIFSNVNRGPPTNKNSCFDVLDSHVDTWGNLLFIISWALFIGLAFSVIAGCLLCCTTDEDDYPVRNNIQYQEVPQQDNNLADEHIQQQSMMQQQLAQQQQQQQQQQ